MTLGAIKNLALYVDVRRKAAVDAARTVAGIAERNHIALHVGPQQARELNLNGVGRAENFPHAADLVVSLGGDGTLLRAAHLAGPLGIPVVGVDFGRIGFLAEVGRAGYEAAIEKILLSGAATEPSLALEARVLGGDKTFYAVNDVHIDRKHLGHIVNFGIELSGEHVAVIPADGIVVASPTGSTAYFLSAGGPIMAPKLAAIGIAPICPHTLFTRPLIVSADETIRIILPEDAEGVQLFVDGEPVVALAGGATVEVVRSPHPIRFVRLDRRYFFHTLERKLHWGMSIKRVIDEEP
jgi:NAD+ kinase